MGLNANPYAVDINQVKAVLGSKDRTLLEKCKTGKQYKNYVSQVKGFDAVLEELFFTYIPPGQRVPGKKGFRLFKKAVDDSGLKVSMGDAYGYALIVVCDCLGTNLLPHLDGFYYGRDYTDAVNILRREGLQVDLDVMFEQHRVFDIPPADFPAMHLFSRQEIDEVNAILSKIPVTTAPDWDDVAEMLEDIRNCFRSCKEKNADLITFCH